jgi:hypothetical protein
LLGFFSNLEFDFFRFFAMEEIGTKIILQDPILEMVLASFHRQQTNSVVSTSKSNLEIMSKCYLSKPKK